MSENKTPDKNKEGDELEKALADIFPGSTIRKLSDQEAGLLLNPTSASSGDATRAMLSLDKEEKARIPWNIDLDLTLLEPLLIRCGRCLQKYSLAPRDDQEHLTHLYECPHCHQPLDSRAWLYAVRNLQKLLRQALSATLPTLDREAVRRAWKLIADKHAFAYNPQYLNEGYVDASIEFIEAASQYGEKKVLRYCDHCNQFADGPIRCCDEYDGKTHDIEEK